MPVTQVPLGLNKDGLPLGLQIVAPRFKDRFCLAVAEEIEKKLIGFVPPFIVKDWKSTYTVLKDIRRDIQKVFGLLHNTIQSVLILIYYIEII